MDPEIEGVVIDIRRRRRRGRSEVVHRSLSPLVQRTWTESVSSWNWWIVSNERARSWLTFPGWVQGIDFDGWPAVAEWKRGLVAAPHTETTGVWRLQWSSGSAGQAARELEQGPGIDPDLLSRDVPGLVAGQEKRQVGDVLRLDVGNGHGLEVIEGWVG